MTYLMKKMGSKNHRLIFVAMALTIIILISIFVTGNTYATTVDQGNGNENAQIDLPGLTVSIDDNGTQTANSIQILIMLTVLSLVPSILVLMTCFTRIIIVLGFLRRAMSLQTTPPNQVLIGLALFLTLFAMAPTFSAIYEDAYIPYSQGETSTEEFAEDAMKPLRDFMFKQVRTKDLTLFMELSGQEQVESKEEIPSVVLIPAFIISEIKTGFEIGFLLFIPFIVIDMIVASTLMALGMMMLPPVMISLPLKLLLFILVDGWNVVIEQLMRGIR